MPLPKDLLDIVLECLNVDESYLLHENGLVESSHYIQAVIAERKFRDKGIRRMIHGKCIYHIKSYFGDYDKVEALRICITTNYLQGANFLLKKKVTIHSDMLICAIYRGLNMTALLLHYGADARGKEPIRNACLTGDVETVKLLIHFGATIDKYDSDNKEVRLLLSELC